jgi:hypothetical protein
MSHRSSVLVLVTLAVACATSRPGPQPAAAVAVPSPAPIAVPSADPVPPVVTFEAAVRPILARRCEPCHNPGGKMYERLPFDDAEVVASHHEGVARRLKDPEEKAAFERWLETRSGGS